VPDRLKAWLAAFAATGAAVVLCYLYVDRPVAFFVHAHLVPNRRLFDALTRIPEYLFVAAAVIFVLAGLTTLLTRRWTRGRGVLLLSALSISAAETIKDVLKFVFGRTWPETWINNNPSLIGDGTYGFNPLHGGAGYASFPSGHTTAVCAVAAVLWVAYPRLRALWTLAVTAVVVGLVGADYHFVGDILAGGFLGASTGWLAVVLWNESELPKLPPPPAAATRDVTGA
jgi:membrane-associated phospholipid phosphatase